QDMPILADVGLAVARLALAGDDPLVAAAVLGAAARVRGAEDRTSPAVARLTSELRDRLGETFAAAYGTGWSLDPGAAIERLDPARLNLVLQARRA
ncbi:MAG: hypothetical protein ACRYG2_14600, partial [Janthinobacterium lividum]